MSVSPNFIDFKNSYKSRQPLVVWTTFVADLETPVSTFLKLAAGRPNSFLLESVEGGAVRGRYSIIGLKPDLIWRCFGDHAEVNTSARFDQTKFINCNENAIISMRNLINDSRIKLPEHLPPMSAGLVGYVGYDMVRHMETLPESKFDPLKLPDAILMRPTIMAIFDSVEDRLTLVTPVWPDYGMNSEMAYALASERLDDTLADLERPLPFDAEVANDQLKDVVTESNTPKNEYISFVERAKKYIEAGDVFQVVPSQRFSTPFVLPPFSLYRALRRLNPSPFLYFLNFGDFAVVGSSPEILVRVRDGKITIRPIAGTRPRGANYIEDAKLADDLLSDPKELAEHLMLLDLGRNDVGRVAEIGSVSVTEKMKIEYYSHVMHIVSNVEGKLEEGKDALDALIAGFPAGTVSGAPKVRAMEIINELEKESRGIYAGAIGYFSASGAMDTCIALRTAIVKDGKMYVQAGGGVVADSDPKAEYEETVNKARALFRAAEEATRFASRKQYQ